MVDAMPGALNWYWATATANDNLISGPSGYGYTYPNSWTDAAQLDRFVTKTEDYDRRAGFRVLTIWNTIVGGINANVGQSFAANAPSMLGLTAQNTGGGLTIYSGKLPGMALSCNYCTNEQAMKDHIASAAAGWNRTSRASPSSRRSPGKGVTPTSFLNVRNSLNADYVVVRPRPPVHADARGQRPARRPDARRQQPGTRRAGQRQPVLRCQRRAREGDQRHGARRQMPRNGARARRPASCRSTCAAPHGQRIRRAPRRRRRRETPRGTRATSASRPAPTASTGAMR
jgi:hypothetical protein